MTSFDPNIKHDFVPGLDDVERQKTECRRCGEYFWRDVTKFITLCHVCRNKFNRKNQLKHLKDRYECRKKFGPVSKSQSKMVKSCGVGYNLIQACVPPSPRGVLWRLCAWFSHVLVAPCVMSMRGVCGESAKLPILARKRTIVAQNHTIPPFPPSSNVSFTPST